MTEDNCSRGSSSESTDSSITKQRKKRKWDQPAESLVSDGVAVSGVLPLGNMGAHVGSTVPGVAPVPGASFMNPLAGSYGALQQVLLSSSIQQHATALVQKIQPKIQEELIAREIVINDAESSVRYKLTKRQTQEEIQKCTGAIVITRGKYRPPNAQPDGEKPLYLHISAMAHLETTADRIKAVDQAASMVEEMLKPGSVSNGVKVAQPFSACVFLGFEPDPSLNIISRIRGPNGQYVNHIMNETGAMVLLRGRGSGSLEGPNSEGEQPLHLFLSSSNPKSLDHAKLLAENLLDTICSECGASRISSCKVYGAVPPPQQLIAGVESSENVFKGNAAPIAGLTSFNADLAPASVLTSVIPLVSTPVLSQGIAPQSIAVCYPQPSLAGGTSYNGYGGIYPQATPLQQVALALRKATSPITSTAAPVINTAGLTPSGNIPSEKDKRPQRRKFQELSLVSNDMAKTHQESGYSKPREVASQLIARNTSNMPAPSKLVQHSSNGMPSPSPRTMPPPPPSKMMPPPPPPSKIMSPPPPPPKFDSSIPPKKSQEKTITRKPEVEEVPEPLVSLMEYGDEDDDDLEETAELPFTSNSNITTAPKPFWAV